MQVVYLLKTGEAGKYEEFSEACRKDSLTAYRDLLTAVRNDTLSLIDSLTDQELESGVAVPQPWFESLRLPLTPRSEVIRSISAHEWYHVGQIVSYLWSRGDDPYQW